MAAAKDFRAMAAAHDPAPAGEAWPRDVDVFRETYYRLTEQLYRRWAPEKIDKVKQNMEKYKGQEDEVYEKAVELYAFGKQREEKDWRPLIEGMYRRFNPSKLRGLDEVLRKYKSNEHALFKALCDKYIPKLTKNDPPLELCVWGVGAEASPVSSGTLGTTPRREENAGVIEVRASPPADGSAERQAPQARDAGHTAAAASSQRRNRAEPRGETPPRREETRREGHRDCAEPSARSSHNSLAAGELAARHADDSRRRQAAARTLEVAELEHSGRRRPRSASRDSERLRRRRCEASRSPDLGSRREGAGRAKDGAREAHAARHARDGRRPSPRRSPRRSPEDGPRNQLHEAVPRGRGDKFVQRSPVRSRDTAQVVQLLSRRAAEEATSMEFGSGEGVAVNGRSAADRISKGGGAGAERDAAEPSDRRRRRHRSGGEGRDADRSRKRHRRGHAPENGGMYAVNPLAYADPEEEKFLVTSALHSFVAAAPRADLDAGLIEAELEYRGQMLPFTLSTTTKLSEVAQMYGQLVSAMVSPTA